MKGIDLLARARLDGVAIIGAGKSGLSVAEYLLGMGVARITLRDRTERVLPPRLVCPALRQISGAGYLDDLYEGVLVRSPGIRPDLPPIAAALRRGSVLTSEIGLFLARSEAQLLAVTGSAGKTTTVALTDAMLRAEGLSCFAAGNNGVSPLPFLTRFQKGSVGVLELSSFQLMDLPLRESVPYRAAILNLTENHLNWHTDMAEYCAAKCRILSGGAPGVFPADDPSLASLAMREGARLFSDTLPPGAKKEYPLADCLYTVEGHQILRTDGKETSRLLSIEGFRLPGRHNLRNLLAAVALTDGLVSSEGMRQAIRAFRGVPHRMEAVSGPRGITCLNSSIDSTPHRTEATLKALTVRPIVLCGGAGKGLSLLPLVRALSLYAKAIVLFGACAGEIEAALAADPAASTVPRTLIREFDGAVEHALSMARPGDTVLLSPACTSFDAFRNFEERGERFRELCHRFAHRNQI